MKRPLLIGGTVVLSFVFASAVVALWSSLSTGPVAAQADTLPAGNQPSASVSPASTDVAVSWAPSTGGAPLEGYNVRAYDALTSVPRLVGGTCAGVVAGTSCTDSGAGDGSWQYAIVPRQQQWSGAESPLGDPVIVDSSYHALVMADGPGAYWRLGESSGTTAVDETGVNNGTYSGGYALGVDGALFDSANTAVDFNGTTAKMNAVSSPSIDFTSSLSVEAWVNYDTLVGTQFVVNKGSYYLYETYGTTIFGVFAGGTFQFVTTSSVSAGSWQHLVGTYNGAEMVLYRNGVVVAQGGVTGAIVPNNNPVPVGQGFDGRLDEVALYGTALTQAQALAHYQRGNGTRPDVQVAFPVNDFSYADASWNAGCTSRVCGTATDTGGGVASVAVSLRQGAGNYWDGTAFASATEVLLPATGTTSWGLDFAPANFPANGAYTARVVATDGSGNEGVARTVFFIDRTAPLIGFWFPAHGSTHGTASWNAGCSSHICGPAADADSYIASIRVSVRQGSGNYWNGTAFASATEVLLTPSGTTSWFLPFPAANFPGDGLYTVTAYATDGAGNIGAASSTVAIDRTAPTATIAFPADGITYGSTSWDAGCNSKICGTAAGTGSAVASMRVSVRQGTGNYWDGTAFASASEVLLTPTGTTNWALPFPATNFPADGSYTVRAIPTDAAGNVGSASSTATIDTSNPDYRSFVMSDGPSAYWRLGESSGTTAVDELGTSDGTYTNGYTLGQPGAMAGDPNTAVALNGSTGRVSVPAAATGANITGNLSVEAWIKPNSTQPGFARVVSRYNGSIVQYMFAYETAGKNLRFLLDVGSGRVTAQSPTELRDGLWHHVVGTWDGSTARLYIDGVQVSTAAGSGAVQLANTTTVIGADSIPSSFFSGVVDETALYAKTLTPAQILTHYQQGSLNRPTAAVTFPVQDGRYNTASWNAGCSSQICGTAADADGTVASVAVSVRRNSTGSFWDGSSFASSTPVLLPATGTTSWTRAFSGSNFPADGSYIVTTVATDDAGNTGGVTRSFVIDRTSPTTAITFPASGGTYNAASWNAGCASRICGTASDASGVASVAVSVRQGTGNYWDGSAFASATEVLLPATGTSSWTRAFAAGNFPADGSYTVRAAASDTVGNTGTTSRTFTIDNTAPTATITFPANDGAYTAATWDAGCSSQVCGTASDPGGTVASVAISVRQGTGNYWDGAAFVSATEVLVPATGTTTWTRAFAAANFPAPGSYTVRAVATDTAGSTGTTSRTFTFLG